MSLKLLAWNIEGRLSPFSKRGRGTPERIVAEIGRHDADVVILPEASDGDDIAPETLQSLEEMGYETHTVYYDDSGFRLHGAEVRPTLKLMSRLPIKNVIRLRCGDIRNALAADVVDPDEQATYRIFGIHLDDRSETNRLAQVTDLMKQVADSPFPVVMAGDFNAMHGDDGRARLLRSVVFRGLGKAVPHTLARDMLRRVSDMAEGTALEAIETGAGLRDVDMRHRPTSTPKLRGQTWLPSVRVLHIDHIYVSSEVRASDFNVARDGGSDHRAISAAISVHPDKH